MMMKILRGARGALLPLALCCVLLLVAGCGAQTAKQLSRMAARTLHFWLHSPTTVRPRFLPKIFEDF